MTIAQRDFVVAAIAVSENEMDGVHDHGVVIARKNVDVGLAVREPENWS